MGEFIGITRQKLAVCDLGLVTAFKHIILKEIHSDL